MRSLIRVDMTVAILKSDLDSLTDLIGSGLPCAETDTRHLIARAEREHRPNGKLALGRWCL